MADFPPKTWTCVPGHELYEVKQRPGHTGHSRSGQGLVCSARKGNQYCVIKFFDTQGANRNNGYYELKRQYDKLSGVIHNNVVKTTDFLEIAPEHGWPRVGFVMEQLRISLSEIFELHAGKRLPAEWVVFWCRQLAAGCHHLHTVSRLVHRDLKPDNIMLRYPAEHHHGALESLRHGTAVIIDLDCASPIGGPQRMEVYQDKWKDERYFRISEKHPKVPPPPPQADVNSLGRVMVALCDRIEGGSELWLRDVANKCIRDDISSGELLRLLEMPDPNAYIRAVHTVFSTGDGLLAAPRHSEMGRPRVADLFVEPDCAEYVRVDAADKVVSESKRRGQTEDAGKEYLRRVQIKAVTAVGYSLFPDPDENEAPSQVVLFKGESGSGKTTLLHFLVWVLSGWKDPSTTESRNNHFGKWKIANRPPVPVYVDLAKVYSDGREFADLFRRAVEEVYARPAAGDELPPDDWEAVCTALQKGRILFLVDNLHFDEAVVESLEKFIEEYGRRGCRFVITSRVLANEEHRLSFGAEVRQDTYSLAPFNSEVGWKELAQRWCAYWQRASGESVVEKTVQEQLRSILLGATWPEHRSPLAIRVLLWCLCDGIPPNDLSSPTKMWHQFVNRMLETRGAIVQDHRTVRSLLENLAFRAWRKTLESDPVRRRIRFSLSSEDFESVIDDFRNTSAPERSGRTIRHSERSALQHFLCDQLSIMNRAEGDGGEGVFLFAHDLLGSFLCGCALVERSDFNDLLFRMWEGKQPIKVAEFAVSFMTHVKEDVSRAVNVLALVVAMTRIAPDSPARRRWLAAEVANGIGAEVLRNNDTGRQFLGMTGELAELLTAGRLQPTERARVGQILSQLGDPRPYVGLRDGIPDIDWVEVPGGVFELGEDQGDDNPEQVKWQSKNIDQFYISRYPITYTQYSAFLNVVKSNSVPDSVWEGLPIGLARCIQDRQSNRFGNHPCDSVSWYEATAFCRWLSRKLNAKVTLPNTKQWQKAAGGGNQHVFPFPGEFDGSRANTRESNLGRTTPVGMYPGGVSPFGVHDMAGNVFEWCSDSIQPGAAEDSDAERHTRGGSWNHTSQRARITVRSSKKRPDEHHPYIGFRVVAEQRPNLTPRILIVGSGAAGTITAIRLLRHSRRRLHIIRVDTAPLRVDGGLAYSQETTDWSMMLNLQAGRISVFREFRFDFVEWINNEADKDGWPLKWVKHYSPSDAVPRRAYQLYLRDRLQRELDCCGMRATVSYEFGKVTDLEICNTGSDSHNLVRVTLTPPGGVPQVIEAEHVVLATGHLANKIPQFLDPSVTQRPECIMDMYSEGSREKIKGLKTNAEVLVFGSGLRADDVPTLLLLPIEHRSPSKTNTPIDHNSESKYTGRITLMSRRGGTHGAYPPDHLHEVIDLSEYEKKILEGFAELPKELAAYEQYIRANFEQLEGFVAEKHPEIPAHVRPERILKAVEGLVKEALPLIPDEILTTLLVKHWSLLTVRRAGLPAEIAALRADPKRVRSVARTVDKVTWDAGTEKFRVESYDDEQHYCEEYDAIVSCLGREADYEAVEDPLWRNLIDKRGYALPDRVTRRGVRVGPSGELLDRDNRMIDVFTAVGLPREGDEIRRYGRLGSFVFALGPIKNQAFGSALRVLRAIGDYGEPLDKFEYPPEPQSGALSVGGVIAEYVERVRPGPPTDADDRKSKITACVERCFEDRVSKMTRAMRDPQSPGSAKVRADLASLLSSDLTRQGLPDGLANLANTCFLAVLEVEAMRRLTDISVVEPKE